MAQLLEKIWPAVAQFGETRQREAIEAFARSQGYELVEILEEEAITGASDPLERKTFPQLLEAVVENKINLVDYTTSSFSNEKYCERRS